jgi:tetratricopeptide (TPR) repeat protein
MRLFRQLCVRALLLCFWTAATSPLWLVWVWSGRRLAAYEEFKAAWGLFALVGLMFSLSLFWLAKVSAAHILHEGRRFGPAVRWTLNDFRRRAALLPAVGRWFIPAPRKQPASQAPAQHRSESQTGSAAAAQTWVRGSIDPPDSHYLQAAEGWIGLGDYATAAKELEQIAPRFITHPDVLKVRWQVHAREENWNLCLHLADTLTQLTPENPSGWIQRALSLHRLGRTREAKDLLLSTVNDFNRAAVFPYHLARFSCALNQPAQARHWLKRALATAKDSGELDQLRQKALDDPHLAEIWKELQPPATAGEGSFGPDI